MTKIELVKIVAQKTGIYQAKVISEVEVIGYTINETIIQK